MCVSINMVTIECLDAASSFFVSRCTFIMTRSLCDLYYTFGSFISFFLLISIAKAFTHLNQMSPGYTNILIIYVVLQILACPHYIYIHTLQIFMQNGCLCAHLYEHVCTYNNLP